MNVVYVNTEMAMSICSIIPFDNGIAVTRGSKHGKYPYCVLTYKVSTPYEHMKDRGFFPSPDCMYSKVQE